MFDEYPTYNPYRALHKTDPVQVGEDVYGLQIALNFVGEFDNPLTPDGILGTKTSKAIPAVQKRLHILGDGIAGQITQIKLTQYISKSFKGTIPLPQGLPGGQISHESSCLLGNYSELRPNQTYDAGVTQRNTEHCSPKKGFDPVNSIEALMTDTLSAYYNYTKVANERRRWELAVAHWNAPSYANWLAGYSTDPNDRPGPTAIATLEAYINSACAYLVI